MLAKGAALIADACFHSLHSECAAAWRQAANLVCCLCRYHERNSTPRAEGRAVARQVKVTSANIFRRTTSLNLPFLRDLFSRPGATRTVVLLEQETMATPRQYEVQPKQLLIFVASIMLGVTLLIIGLILFTPIRGLFSGTDLEDYRGVAELNAHRAVALEDSVAIQYRQITQLRALITGDLDSLTTTVPISENMVLPEASEVEAVLGVTLDEAESANQTDHEQPAIPFRWLDVSDDREPLSESATEAYLASLRLPALPPAEGFFTRGFNARQAHFGVDIAVEEGSPIRAVGNGYVVFADWTHEGGYVVAVQHADGYLSIYKHNARLLNRVGDRVRSRETVAISGNSGEITTGPHLHFELWRNGLAQDPRTFFVIP